MVSVQREELSVDRVLTAFMQISYLRLTIAVVCSSLIFVYGLKKKSLSKSGAVLAFFVGFTVAVINGCLYIALLAFFLSSSRLTKWKGHIKRKLEADYREGGQRNWMQVFSNGFAVTATSLLYAAATGTAGGEQPLRWFQSSTTPHLPTLLCASGLAALACCCGDTWASEIGTVVGGEPRLVTSGHPVPKGTNGGVTPIGLLVSFAGGLFVGLAFYVSLLVFAALGVAGDLSAVSTPNQWFVVVFGGLSGLFGSLVDSLLGAVLQFSGVSQRSGTVVSEPGPGVDHISGVNVLSNNTVNLISSVFTAIAAPSLLFCWSYLYS